MATSSHLKRFLVPGALVVGGMTAGSMLAPVAVAAAQDDPTDAVDSDSDESDGTDGDDADASDGSDESDATRGRSHYLHRALHGALHLAAEVVAETLDLPVSELRDELSEGKSLADIAGDQGVPVEELEEALVAAAEERIDAAVAEDRLDADRAAELKDGLGERIAEMIERTPGDGDGWGRPGRGLGHGRHGAGGEALAEFLGLTVDELRTALADGRTLAEVAEAEGVSTDDLVAFLVDRVEERLDQAVENGRIDSDDAAEKLAEAEERIEDHVNSESGSGFGFGGRGHGHRRGHHHHRGGDATDGADADGTERDSSDTSGETVESSLNV